MTAYHKTLHIILMGYLLTAILSCTPHPKGHVVAGEGMPPIYPDYADITIPANIAPLNFLVRGETDAVEVRAVCDDHTLCVNQTGNKVCFNRSEWHDLLQAAVGKNIDVTLSVRRSKPSGEKEWVRWTFTWQVVSDPVDPFLTYRLIEPDYEIWNHLSIEQRCTENFETTDICNYQHADNQCMNCHTYAQQNPQLSMLYVRGSQGGAMLNTNGQLRKLNIKTEDMVSGSVYFGFSPSGRYITFSTNIIIPGFHSQARKRLEVYDSRSDVYVADLHTNRIISSPLTADSTTLETFPTFSPDGKYIYYCAAKKVSLPQDIRHLQYSLIRIPFDEQTGTIGNRVDTIYPRATHQATAAHKTSVCHPRISPDGHYLLFTVQDYGTFPIWHPEADLRLLDLRTGAVDTLSLVNSQKSDTYHSWSSNSRWFVFASKRDDGLYGKPYFCYIDYHGKAHKPFVLPQKDPTMYDNTLKSYNAPELGRGPLPFTAKDIQRAMQQQGETFKP